MPELPDVEVFKRTLEAGGLYQRIRRVRVLDPRALQGVSAERLRGALVGRRLDGRRRHGKWLFARIEGGDAGWLVLHFGMSGDLTTYDEEEARPEHTRVVLDLEPERHLAYVCQRLFGGVGLTPDPARFLEERGLGPDALALDEAGFRELLERRDRAVKALLMDQTKIAGLGNVYSDEVLFQAHLHPDARTGALGRKDQRRLYRTMRRVLEEAIARGADPDAMPRTWLTPHRGDEVCPRCGAPLRRMAAAGRSAWLCEGCQPLRTAA